MQKILRVFHIKFRQNVNTLESHENCYNDVLGHNDHESGLIFIITIVFVFSILWPVNSTRIEVENMFSHFTTSILVLQEYCIEVKLWRLIMFISYCHQISNNFNNYEENVNNVN